ncbi:5-formyltetrahydrofolate cyclo-ligase [Peptostreptococcaceae bacterium AS15]|nr:5-formyltetrahydrofolate cyclo-ligase [Peptostreptococcaceae bacterium AS15]
MFLKVREKIKKGRFTMDKKTLRKKILTERDKNSHDEIILKSSIIFDKITKTEIFENAKNIMTFVSFGSEVDTSKFISLCLSLGKNVSIPYVKDAKNSVMVASRLYDVNDLVKGYMDIPELPLEKLDEVDKTEIDIIITPCVCFDVNRYRVGYGKGFYDRFFIGCNAVKIGVCFDECIVESIDIDQYDVAADMVVTDKRIFI